MAQITVTIDGKNYRMACEEGQQEHLTMLAKRFDTYVGHLKDQFGAIGDQRLTVMAGIMIMDELAELQKRVADLEASARDKAAVPKSAFNEPALVDVLGGLAERMEDLAARLVPRA